MSEHSSPRVNGAMLAKFVGRTVRITCKVLRFEGDHAVVESSDKMPIEVQLTSDAQLTDTYAEIVGKVKDAATIQMMACINMGDKLDMELVEFTIQTIHDPRFFGTVF